MAFGRLIRREVTVSSARCDESNSNVVLGRVCVEDEDNQQVRPSVSHSLS